MNNKEINSLRASITHCRKNLDGIRQASIQAIGDLDVLTGKLDEMVSQNLWNGHERVIDAARTERTPRSRKPLTEADIRRIVATMVNPK